jgi:hypothetical protein
MAISDPYSAQADPSYDPTSGAAQRDAEWEQRLQSQREQLLQALANQYYLNQQAEAQGASVLDAAAKALYNYLANSGIPDVTQSYFGANTPQGRQAWQQYFAQQQNQQGQGGGNSGS